MPDSIGRLNAALAGRYLVERQLGEGGMAIVYLADDLKHGRKVALKVLKPELAAVVGAKRFLAEIRTTATLQHPHILPLYDSGDADGPYYVMPRVEGESLRERLDRERQLPVEEAVRIATKVAEALAYAHRHGVTHRDIKPANILLHDGEPVITDFGIALAVTVGGAARLTETGLSLGTPHYMSPEQATGDQSVGPATDIWALACVLYEMLAGEPPYTGSTPHAVLGKIITAEPASGTGARKSTPPNVDAAIRKALEKVPADRFTNASEFAKALVDRSFRHEADVVSGSANETRRRKPAIGLAVATAVLAVFLAWGVSELRRPVPLLVARFDVTPPEAGRLLAGETDPDLALSPDGRTIVYRGVRPGGGSQLWLRSLESLEATALQGTEGSDAAVFSPDGGSVAFQVGGAIRIVSLDGGPPVTIVTAEGGPAHSLVLASDGMIYFGRGDVIYRVPITGGDPEPATPPASGLLRFPDALPGGRGLLVTRVGAYPQLNRIALAVPGGDLEEILAGTMARYAATGHVVYATAEGTLMAVPFDIERLEVTGPAVALVEGVSVKPTGAAQFALSASGTLLYGSGGGAGELSWVSRAGVVEPIDPSWTERFAHPALSPDESRLAVAVRHEVSMHVWVKQLDRGPSHQLTLEGNLNGYPVWTPDGTSVTFFSDRDGPSFNLLTQPADGSGQADLAVDQPRALAESAWSRDGAWLLFRTDRSAPGAGDILAARQGSATPPLEIVATAFAETAPALSPDGRWLAYTSNESGSEETYVVPFPEARGAKWVVSADGGTEPVWSRSGRELFFRSGRGEMVAVQVVTEPTFSTGEREVLFMASEYRADLNHPQYDVSSDADRFLMIRPVVGQGELTLVQNFSEELKRLAPN